MPHRAERELTREQAAARVGVTTRTIDRARANGLPYRQVKKGARVTIKQGDLLRYFGMLALVLVLVLLSLIDSIQDVLT